MLLLNPFIEQTELSLASNSLACQAGSYAERTDNGALQRPSRDPCDVLQLSASPFF